MKIIFVFLVTALLSLHTHAEEAVYLHLSCEKIDGENCVEMSFSEVDEKTKVLKTHALKLTHQEIESVRPSRDLSGTPVLTFKVKKDQARQLKNITAHNIGKDLAIVIDGQVFMASKIERPIGDGVIALYIGKKESESGKKLGWLKKRIKTMPRARK